VGWGREGVGLGCGSRDSACSNVIVTLIIIMLTCSSDPANPNPDHNYVTLAKTLILNHSLTLATSLVTVFSITE